MLQARNLSNYYGLLPGAISNRLIEDIVSPFIVRYIRLLLTNPLTKYNFEIPTHALQLLPGTPNFPHLLRTFEL